MSDDIKNLIRSAMDKDADAFETNFDTALAPKLDAALTAKYDEMFGKPAGEEVETETEAEIDDTSETEEELEPEEAEEKEDA
tara:strand:+ start:296 stop:541 length:246 start_codon:yes stop_codon:yes gene_type:complete